MNIDSLFSISIDARPDCPFALLHSHSSGTFIEGKILNFFNRKDGYWEKSEAIKGNVIFCEKALPKIRLE